MILGVITRSNVVTRVRQRADEAPCWTAGTLTLSSPPNQSPGGYLHVPGSLGIRSGRHAHATGSLSANYCCNGSVGLNWHTTCTWCVGVWELCINNSFISAHCCTHHLPGGLEKKKKKQKWRALSLPTNKAEILQPLRSSGSKLTLTWNPATTPQYPL